MQDDDIRVFLQLVASRSLTRAAKLLRRPKATLSHQLRRLEAELGTTLFDRLPSGMRLTDAGHEFVPLAEAIGKSVQTARDMGRRYSVASEQSVSVATSVEFAANIVTSMFLDLFKDDPELRFSAMSFPRDTLPEICHLFDLTLYLGEPRDIEFQNMRARRLGEFECGLHASPGYLGRHGTPTHPSELAGHRLIVHREHSEPRQWTLTSGDDQASFTPDARLESNDPWTIKIAASLGEGICILPEFFTAMEAEAGVLARVMPDWRAEVLPFYALYAAERSGNTRLMALLDGAAENIENLQRYSYHSTSITP